MVDASMRALLSLAVLIPTLGDVVMAKGPRTKGAFTDHGVAAPVSRARGVAAAADGDGRPVVLVWLSDHRGCKAMLIIDAETGETSMVPTPRTGRDSPFAVIMSSKERFYSFFGGTFLEFDPSKRAFTFSGKGGGRAAMAMVEDANGVIWAANYPNSALVAFDPKTRRLTDYGSVNKESWRQYARTLAVGRDGWVYLGIGNVRSQIVAFYPKTRERRGLAKEEERRLGGGRVYVGRDGKVYGRMCKGGPWYELTGGRALLLKKQTRRYPARPAPTRSGSQGALFRVFPDGSRILGLDIPEKQLAIRTKDGKTRRLTFDYRSEGSYILSIIGGPDGRLYGSTGHPLRVYCIDPETGETTNRGLLNYSGHLNALTVQGGKLYGARYSGGALHEYDPSKPWADRAKGAKRNPVLLKSAAPTINRPHALLATADGRYVIMAGTPGYGRTGGGLLFYDLKTRAARIVPHTRLIRNHSTVALIELPKGRLLGGTTIAPGTGGETLAKEAELYVMDLASRKIVWREVIVPGTPTIRDLLLGPDGLVYGIAQGPVFFVFDPASRKVVHKRKLTQYGKAAGGQAPRILALGPDKRIYALFQDAIVRITPGTFAMKKLAKPPVKIGAGVVLRKGRLYFTQGSHVWSYKVPGL